MTNSSILMDAYWQSMKECDSPSDAAALGAMATSTSAFTFLAIYSIGVFLQLCILPANLRLAKHRSAFLLLLHINFLDLIWLLQYIWLCFEFIILGHRLHIPASLDAYLFRLVNFCIDALYFQLALNRAMAVLDASGRIFERLFNQKNNKFYLLFTWSAGILYSFYSNWHPVRRPFHCLSQLGYFEPTSTIPKHLLALLPDSIFYDGIQQFYMICIYIPILLYIAAFIKLFHKFIDRLFAANSGSIEPLHPFNPDNNKFHAQFANLALERSRLFLLCFFSQLPYLLANGLDHLTRIFQLNEQMVKNMAILGQFFGTIFHVQQPILMLLLSKDMRREVSEDIRRYFRK